MRPHRSPSLRWLRGTQAFSKRPIPASRRTSRPSRPHHRPFSSLRAQHDAQPSQWSTGPSNVAIHDMNSRLTWKRAMLWSFYVTSAFVMFKYSRILWGEIGEVAEELDDEELDEDSLSLSEALFISLNRPKQLPLQFYKQSDPDWKEYHKLSRDPDRQQDIRQELAERVGRTISGHPQLAIRLGKDLAINRYWLDMKYPDGPPPEYRRFGIEITDQWISLKSQKIPFSHYVQLYHIFWPQAIFYASVSSIWVVYRLQVLRAKNMLGFQLNKSDQSVQRLLNVEHLRNQLQADLASAKGDADAIKAAHDKVRRRLEEARNPKSSRPNPPDLPASPSAAAASSSPSTTDPTEQDPQTPQPKRPSITSSIWSAITQPRSVISNTDTHFSYFLSWIPTPPIPTPEVLLQPLTQNTDLNLGWRFFAAALYKSWSTTKMDLAPKGAVFVVGQVEVSGSLARCKVDVNAAYDPRTAKFLYTICTPRHIWEHSQTAKGGP